MRAVPEHVAGFPYHPVNVADGTVLFENVGFGNEYHITFRQTAVRRPLRQCLRVDQTPVISGALGNRLPAVALHLDIVANAAAVNGIDIQPRVKAFTFIRRRCKIEAWI